MQNVTLLVSFSVARVLNRLYRQYVHFSGEIDEIQYGEIAYLAFLRLPMAVQGLN